MTKQLTFVSLFFSALTVGSAGQFCYSVPAGPQQESIDEMRARYDVVVIARRMDEVESDDDISSAWSAAEFQMLDALNETAPPLSRTFVAPCRKADRGREVFLLAGMSPKTDSSHNRADIRWRLARPVSIAFRHHALKIVNLKTKPLDRLKFYSEFVMDSDEDISSNAALQLMTASDDVFAKVSTGMDRMVFRAGLEDSDLPQHLQSLYLAVLAHCGNQVDAAWLQAQIATRSESSGLEAWIGCYLTLAGQEGLAFVERQFLQADRPFMDRYAVMLALRYVRDQHPASLPREALLKSLRRILDDEQLADLVVTDLAYLEDWDSLERLIDMYQAPGAVWIRPQIVNFVRVCPLPRAAEAMKQLRQTDASAVKRAEQFWIDEAVIRKPRHSRIRVIHRGNSGFRC